MSEQNSAFGMCDPDHQFYLECFSPVISGVARLVVNALRTNLPIFDEKILGLPELLSRKLQPRLVFIRTHFQV